jgi:hypothetical protein
VRRTIDNPDAQHAVLVCVAYLPDRFEEVGQRSAFVVIVAITAAIRGFVSSSALLLL